MQHAEEQDGGGGVGGGGRRGYSPGRSYSSRGDDWRAAAPPPSTSPIPESPYRASPRCEIKCSLDLHIRAIWILSTACSLERERYLGPTGWRLDACACVDLQGSVQLPKRRRLLPIVIAQPIGGGHGPGDPGVVALMHGAAGVCTNATDACSEVYST